MRRVDLPAFATSLSTNLWSKKECLYSTCT